MKDSTHLRKWIGAATAATLGVTALSGCNLAASNHVLDQSKAIAATCPSGQRVASYVSSDISASNVRPKMTGDFEKVVWDAASRTLICGGRLRVTVFGATTAGVRELFDQDLTLKGATENARYLRAPDDARDVVEAVAAAYEEAAKHPASGTDAINQLDLVFQYAAQVGADYRTEAYLITDGFQTAEVTRGQFATPERAAAAAKVVRAPKLDGVVVTIAGIGNVNGQLPSARTVNSLLAYYTTVCERTKASRCSVVGNYVAKTDW